MNREGKLEDEGSITIDAENGCIKIDKQPDFVFNDIFGPAVQQSTVFKQIGLPLVDGLFEGNNVCMFAFGQTGAGKTYSMLGVKGGHGKSFDGSYAQMSLLFFNIRIYICIQKSFNIRMAVNGGFLWIAITSIRVHNTGIIPRAAKEVFTRISQREHAARQVIHTPKTIIICNI